ncbi:N-acetylneuraminate synthase family protein [Candidatus Pelagibacter sp.]|nr:N-acetylneuraminate synthase family protein [Candidatus Pelagibacter sp.]
MNSIKLGKRIINNESSPYIIAEIGVNHECSISKAKKLILKAKEGGADAAKFQTYKAELITSKNSPSYWDTNKEKTKSQFKLFKKYDHFNENDYSELYKYCKKLNIDFASTPFDHDAVDMLDPFVSYFKISSSDITNFPLLKKIASKEKPILLSTGASSIIEIKNAIKILKKNQCKSIVIMHCILNYPTINENANLGMINDLKKIFPKNLIGYSDHTLPDREMTNLLIAYVLGAKVLEKHFTLNKKKIGNDHYHSMDSKDLKNLTDRILKVRKIFGKNKKTCLNSELVPRKYARRSLVLTNDIKKDRILSSKDIVCKRPGIGISPVDLSKVIGKKIVKNLSEDHILKWSDLKE